MDDTNNIGATISQAVTLLYPYFTAIGLGMARPFGLCLMLPVISRATLGAVIEGGFAFALALPSAEPIRQSLHDAALTNALPLVIYGAKDVLVGIFLGAMLGIPIWAVQCVGEVIDVQRGQTSGQQSDPGGSGEMNQTAALLSQGAMGLFVLANGFGSVCVTLYGSYRAWPLLTLFPTMTDALPRFFLGLMDHIFRFALVTGGPVVIMMLVADLTCVLIGRAVPKLNTPDIVPTVKSLIFVGFMTLYLSFLLTYSSQELSHVTAVGDQFKALFDGNAAMPGQVP